VSAHTYSRTSTVRTAVNVRPHGCRSGGRPTAQRSGTHSRLLRWYPLVTTCASLVGVWFHRHGDHWTYRAPP
jgi:hypothetical protein